MRPSPALLLDNLNSDFPEALVWSVGCCHLRASMGNRAFQGFMDLPGSPFLRQVRQRHGTDSDSTASEP